MRHWVYVEDGCQRVVVAGPYRRASVAAPQVPAEVARAEARAGRAGLRGGVLGCEGVPPYPLAAGIVAGPEALRFPPERHTPFVQLSQETTSVGSSHYGATTAARLLGEEWSELAGVRETAVLP